MNKAQGLARPKSLRSHLETVLRYRCHVPKQALSFVLLLFILFRSDTSSLVAFSDAVILDEPNSPSTDCWHFYLHSPQFCQWLLVSPAGTTSKYMRLSISVWVLRQSDFEISHLHSLAPHHPIQCSSVKPAQLSP